MGEERVCRDRGENVVYIGAVHHLQIPILSAHSW